MSPGKTTFCGTAAALLLLLLGCANDITNNNCFGGPVLITADGKVVDMGGTVKFETTLETPDCVPGIEG